MRPCVVISPDEMNRYIRTVMIAPMTSTQRDYPSRVSVTFQCKKGQVVLDQIRTVDKPCLVRWLDEKYQAAMFLRSRFFRMLPGYKHHMLSLYFPVEIFWKARPVAGFHQKGDIRLPKCF